MIKPCTKCNIALVHEHCRLCGHVAYPTVRRCASCGFESREPAVICHCDRVDFIIDSSPPKHGGRDGCGGVIPDNGLRPEDSQRGSE